MIAKIALVLIFILFHSVSYASKYVYLNNQGSLIYEYKIETNEEWTLIAVTPSLHKTRITSMTLSPSGRFLYTTVEDWRQDFYEYYIRVYQVGHDGKLTLSGAINPIKSSLNYLVFNPSNTYAYLADILDKSIQTYKVNADGSLVFLSRFSMPLDPCAPNYIQQIAASGHFVYVQDFRRIHTYKIGLDGMLTFVATHPLENDQHGQMTLDPSEQFIYVTPYADSFENKIYMYKPNLNGFLMPLSPPTAPVGREAILSLVVTPVKKFAYAINRRDKSLSLYKISENGVILPLFQPNLQMPDSPEFIFTDPLGNFIYVTINVPGKLYEILKYKIENDGQLSLLSNPMLPEVKWISNLIFNIIE